jgi:flagellin-like protein
MNHRGLSPIIATVLLVAFAVALGAMILNWSTDFAGPCEKITLYEQSSEPGVPDAFCFDGNSLRYKVLNSANIPIDKFLLRSTTDVPDSGIGENQVAERRVELKQIGGSRIELVPQILVEGKLLTCDQSSIKHDIVPPCPT